jgi:flavin reductase (DIM6/NTAB) family NADH-FMN oxidoreductase RutF
MQKKVRHADAIKRKYPEAVAIAIAKDASGKHNPIALGWVMPTSGSPPMFAISIAPQRHSCDAVRQAGEFVLSFPSAAQAEEALFHGTKSGRDMDKLAEFGSATVPAAEIDSVLLADAVANFECRLVSEHASGDHVIFVGEVVAAHVNEDASVTRLYTTAPGYVMGGVRPA